MTYIKFRKQLEPFAWNIVASAATQGATLVTNFIIVRMTTVHLFGQYSAIQATLFALVAISQLSAWFSATKFTAELIDSDPRSLEKILGLISLTTMIAGGAATAALVAVAKWYSTSALGDAGLESGTMTAAAYVFFTVTGSVQAGVLLGSGAIKAYARLSLALTLPSILLPVAGAIAGGVTGALAGLSFAATLRFFVTRHYAMRELRIRDIRVRYRGLSSQIPVLWRFSLPASANGLTNASASWLVTLFVLHAKGGLADVALLGTVSTFKTFALFIPYQVNNVSIALINRSLGRDESRIAFRNNLAVLIGMSLATAVGLSLFAAPVLTLYSPSFLRGTSLLRLYLWGSVLEAASFALMQHFSAGRTLWRPFIFGALPRDIAFVAISLALLPRLQLQAVGTAYAVSWGACACGYACLIAWDAGFQHLQAGHR